MIKDISKAELALQKKINQKFQRFVDIRHPTPQDAFALAEQHTIPLHPNYNLFWHDLPLENVITLATYIKEHGTLMVSENLLLTLPSNPQIKEILIELGLLHKQRDGQFIIDHYAYPLLRCCGLEIKEGQIVTTDRWSLPTEDDSTIAYISRLSGVIIRARAPFRIGTRMGRPEKASPRKMRPPPHVLFPLGN